MANLESRDRSGGGLLRPFTDMWNFDPFRNFISPMAPLSGINVTRSESGYSVEIPVPGFRPDDIDVTFEDGTVTVNGKGEKRNFTRTLVVPEDVDPEQISAHVENGMLTLTLALHPKAQPKKIAIKTTTNQPSQSNQ